MPDGGLHRADRTATRLPARFAPQFAEALELDRVADGGAGRVTLDQVHVARLPPGVLVGASHRSQLAFLRGREQVAVHVVRKPDSGNHRVNCVAVRERVGEALQHEDARALADHEPVGGRVERRTPARRRQRAELREAHLRVLAIRSRASAREHRVGAPGEQFVRGELDRVQRRRARRVERVAAAAESQTLREQTGR